MYACSFHVQFINRNRQNSGDKKGRGLGNLSTVNSEIFARVYFRETSFVRSFVKIKSSLNDEISLSLTYEVKSCHGREFIRRKHVF